MNPSTCVSSRRSGEHAWCNSSGPRRETMVTTSSLVAELSGKLIAVARYDRVGPNEAEVAFTVRDDDQGRGLATMLLEHLAAMARPYGIAVFSADILPTNSKMLHVFRDAGWETEHSFQGGTIHVEFPIRASADVVAAIEAREHHAEAESVARLLNPRSIAVIGASRRSGTIGHEVFRNLLEYGFQGPVYPVNPTATSVAGVRAYPSVLDVPDEVDVAIVVVPAGDVSEVTTQCAEKRVRGLVIITAGFAETGAAGSEEQRAIVANARRNGMRIIGPNCLGVVNTAPDVQMNATFAPGTPVAGNVGFLSQSGGLGIELMARAGDLGIGISDFVAVGNKADVSGNDLLQHWERDPRTDVILLYLESFGNPRKFARLARRRVHDEADRRGQEWPHGRRKPGGIVAHGRARRARCRSRCALPPSRRDPRRHPRGPSLDRNGSRAPAAPERAPGRDRLERRRAWNLGGGCLRGCRSRHPRAGRSNTTGAPQLCRRRRDGSQSDRSDRGRECRRFRTRDARRACRSVD